MANEEQRPKAAFKSSIWFVGLLISGFCLFAGLNFKSGLIISTNCYPANHYQKIKPEKNNPNPLRVNNVAEILEHPLSENELAAQSCSCHPNKVPDKVESTSSLTLEIRNNETGESITVPSECGGSEAHWHEGAAF